MEFHAQSKHRSWYVFPQFEAAGTKLEIEIFGNRVPVTVGAEPLFDPKNERLRS